VPVLCEKPCGLTTQQIHSAADAAKKRGVPLQVGYWRRFVPALQHLRQQMIGGELGDIYLVVCHQWDAAPPPPEFRASSGGIFVDMGVHEFDQIRWLSGQEFMRLEPAVSAIAADLTRLPTTPRAQRSYARCQRVLSHLSRLAADPGSATCAVFRSLEPATRRNTDSSGPRTAMRRSSSPSLASGSLRRLGSCGVPAGASAADAVAALRAAEQASVVFNR
jgi:myo-inositol 2-dehydrogenase / D-chiro-inositol 1-dehydrogenase